MPRARRDQERGLQRKLTRWQLTMIALGGAIGVGWTVPLFLGWLALVTFLYFLRRNKP